MKIILKKGLRPEYLNSKTSLDSYFPDCLRRRLKLQWVRKMGKKINENF